MSLIRGVSMQLNRCIMEQYYGMSQKIAEAIKAVTGIDVTIMNENMDRISGTGVYENFIGEKIEKNTVFYYCLSSGNPQIVVNQSIDNEICKKCPRYLTCLEKALICVPIIQDNQAAGVIGVIAFNEEQKDKIAQNNKIYLNFLEKMADLLSAKYFEYKINFERQLLNDRLVGALNLMNAGIVLYDKEGNTLYKNKDLSILLKNIGIVDEEAFVKKVWNDALLKQDFLKETYSDPCEILVEYNNEKYSLLTSAAYIRGNETILTLQDVSKFKKQIAQSIAKNQIKFGFDNILGISRGMLEARSLAEKAALTDSNVLIYGESGTGKELFARAIHDHSNRAEQPLVTINCGAIPDGLLESELFGHEKGAFTGAYANKMGKFEVADGGTVFLDEVSEMPFRLQVKLLRVIQEREICRLGSNKMRKVNVRIIAATNANLLQRMEDGLFREDLYYRLNVVPILIPPLKERKEDIEFIAKHFMRYYSGIFNKNIKGISDEVLELFMRYTWPGNVRELQSVIECAVNFENSHILGMEFIGKRLKIDKRENDKDGSYESRCLSVALRDYERKVIRDTIRKYIHLDRKEDIAQLSCKDLRISRATFYRKLKGMNISLDDEICLNGEKQPLKLLI